MPRVDYCFGCWPGGPVATPPCLRCSSRKDYYASGLCERCHPSAVPKVDSCLDCLAWGATRHWSWLCHGCRSWRRENHVIDPCPSCRRTLTLGQHGVCRLCRRQARSNRSRRGRLDTAAANLHGQQLFIADLFGPRPATASPPPPVPTPPPEPIPTAPTHQQLALFTVSRNLRAHGRRGLPPPPRPALAAALEAHLRDHAETHGWPPRSADEVRHALRVLLGLQDEPGALIKATEVTPLTGIGLPARRTLEVLASAGMLDDDRPSNVARWFEAKIAHLPAPMADELRIWFEVMHCGSTTPPRRRPRTDNAIYLHTRWALPPLEQWAHEGHTSLREIARADIHAALPPSGNPRATRGQALKSIFRVLAGKKVLFTDPTSRIHTGYIPSSQPLPVELALVREGLDSPDPARAALVALMAYHALRSTQLRMIALSDVYDGRLHIEDRDIPLAEPARARIAAYLDHRTRTWPRTANPYLFVNTRSAPRTTPVGPRWVRLIIGPRISPQALREDRILDEARATGGDARRLCDLFGLSISAATRYTDSLGHPQLEHLDGN
ncbi:hypothetical protein [Yinghuangia seranimata]|uniref:hypothetical protein n=1 Tax=Yinghuangia seranimata TaxID=408067 RepID=UPI00248C4D3D|nr:hypothetical protein [Yinghuangia seranimata]MDI2127140.1 hypothetical protein [Yinghuangia seranimata]